MRAAATNRQSTSSSTSLSKTTDASTKSDKKSQLRGLSFDEATKALSPDGATQTTATQGGGKGGKGLPPEIEALGLEHVKVTCTLEAWAALSADEQAGVISFLTQKEAECQTSKKIKGSRVEIGMGKKLVAVDENALAAEEKKASDNQALLRSGKGPMGTDKVIGVKEGEPKITKTESQTVTEVPVKETKEMKDHFDAAGSTFDSADYKPEDMQQSGVVALLEQAAQKILEYLAMDPEAKVTLTVVASESHVTNPAQFKEPGSLAAARAANGVSLAQAHFAARGIPLANVSFTTQNLGANGPAWDPKAGISKHDPMYTAHQFVRLEVAAEVEVEGDKTEQVPQEPTETKTYDAQTIKMQVNDQHRMKVGGGREPSFKATKNQKAPRVKKSKKNKKYKTVACPWKK